jgi:hypothetical protein
VLHTHTSSAGGDQLAYVSCSSTCICVHTCEPDDGYQAETRSPVISSFLCLSPGQCGCYKLQPCTKQHCMVLQATPDSSRLVLQATFAARLKGSHHTATARPSTSRQQCSTNIKRQSGNTANRNSVVPSHCYTAADQLLWHPQCVQLHFERGQQPFC